MKPGAESSLRNDPTDHRRSAATHLHWVVKVACRLQEALEAIRLLSRNSQDKQFFWKTKEKSKTNVSFMSTNQVTWMEHIANNCCSSWVPLVSLVLLGPVRSCGSLQLLLVWASTNIGQPRVNNFFSLVTYHCVSTNIFLFMFRSNLPLFKVKHNVPFNSNKWFIGYQHALQ